MPNHEENKNIKNSKQGFAAMDKKQQREIASKGGKSKSSTTKTTSR